MACPTCPAKRCLRAQVAKSAKMLSRSNDAEMAQLRVHRMRYEELLNKQPQRYGKPRQANGQPR